MSHKKIIKQKIDKYENPEIVDLKENNQEQTMEMHISAKGFKKKRETLTAAEMKKMLSDFKTEINTNTITMITTFKNEINSNMVTMITTLKNEVNSNMTKMENRINSRIDNLQTEMNNLKSDFNEIKSNIDNLKDEMNNRFDNLDLRVTTLEGFHQVDFAKN